MNLFQLFYSQVYPHKKTNKKTVNKTTKFHLACIHKMKKLQANCGRFWVWTQGWYSVLVLQFKSVILMIFQKWKTGVFEKWYCVTKNSTRHHHNCMFLANSAHWVSYNVKFIFSLKVKISRRSIFSTFSDLNLCFWVWDDE